MDMDAIIHLHGKPVNNGYTNITQLELWIQSEILVAIATKPSDLSNTDGYTHT